MRAVHGRRQRRRRGLSTPPRSPDNHSRLASNTLPALTSDRTMGAGQSTGAGGSSERVVLAVDDSAISGEARLHAGVLVGLKSEGERHRRRVWSALFGAPDRRGSRVPGFSKRRS